MWVKWSHEYNELSASVFIMEISGLGYMVGLNKLLCSREGLC